MTRSRQPGPRTRGAQASALELGGASTRYARLSTRPLHILVFLLPLIAAYEVGSVLYLGSGTDVAQVVRAQRILGEFFAWFGVSGLHLPAILAVIVLLVWQFISGDRWRIRWGVIGGMWVESMLWTVPLLVLGLIVVRAISAEMGGGLHSASAGAGGLLAAAGVDGSGATDWRGQATIAIGAGVYEELLFRMVGIALVHLVLVDFLAMKDMFGRIGAVVLTSIAFALYHDVVVHGGGVDWPRLIYYFVAGAYFAVLYLGRGFGIVVAVHALYDIVVLVRPFG
jgi:hypothetical protein